MMLATTPTYQSERT